MSRFKDFDTAISEAEKEPVTFKCGGQSFTLPSELPAIVAVKAIRLKKEYGSEAAIPEAEQLDMALAIFGAESLDKLLATGISVDKLGDILQWAIAVYSGAEPEGGDSGNAVAPEAEAGA